MAAEMQDMLVELTTSEANRLRKWGSLWLDLLHADMALFEREKLMDNFSNVFARRAFWESAVVSYGRMEALDWKKSRDLEHEELLRAAGGEKALAFHAEIMGWRHGHVAHRKDKEFEDTALVAQYADEFGDELVALRLKVSTAVGPADDSRQAVEFRGHVKRIRDTLWENYLNPPRREDPTAAKEQIRDAVQGLRG